MLNSLSVHHRVARSLDFLGTALKVVAGTPDVKDLEKIKFTEAWLIDAHNSQIEINTRTQVRINELTTTVNQILKFRLSQIALMAGAIFCALICVGLTYQRATRAKRSADHLKEVITQIGSPEGRVVNWVNRTDRPHSSTGQIADQAFGRKLIHSLGKSSAHLQRPLWSFLYFSF